MVLKEDWPFCVGALVLVLWVAASLALGPEYPYLSAGWSNGFILALAIALSLAPCLMRARYRAVANLLANLSEVALELGDLDTVCRELNRNRVAGEGVTQYLSQIVEVLDENLRRFEAASLSQKRIEEELIGLRQAKGEMKRQVCAWEDAAIEYFRILERILSFSSIDMGLRGSTERAVSDFSGLVSSLGLQLIRPEQNSVLNQDLCVVESIEPSQEVEGGRIVRCTAWGFRRSSGEVMKASVIQAKEIRECPTSKLGSENVGME